MTHSKRAIATKMLENAWMHVARSYRIEESRAAHDVIAEAERLVRNGFKAWGHAEWNNQIQTVFTLWPDSRG